MTLSRGPADPPPVGAPPDFRERLARALGTAEPDALAAAESDYRGVHESEHAYIVAQVAEHLQPPDMTWLLACCDPDMLREGYQGRALTVWSIPLHPGARMIFESVGEPPARVAATPQLDDPRESPCPHCGARDWTLFSHAADATLTPLGCDRCLTPPRTSACCGWRPTAPSWPRGSWS